VERIEVNFVFECFSPSINQTGLYNKKCNLYDNEKEILEIAPAKFFKLVIIRPKYAKKDEEGVLIGENCN